MSASGRSGTAYGHIAKGSGADVCGKLADEGRQLNNIHRYIRAMGDEGSRLVSVARVAETPQ